MNITIFGATGSLGQGLVEQALLASHNVTVLVRNSNKLSDIQKQKLNVVEGDIFNVLDISQTINTDTDAVLFALGVVKGSPTHCCPINN